MYGRSHCALFVKAYEATKPVAPDAVRKSIAEWAENDDLCDRLNALFEKTNDPKDFLSFAKNSGRTVVGRTCIKERGEEE